MDYKENVRAILETHFAGFKYELIESATERIYELYRNDLDGSNHRADIFAQWNGNLFYGRHPMEARFVCSHCNRQTNIMTRYCSYCGCRMMEDSK